MACPIALWLAILLLVGPAAGEKTLVGHASYVMSVAWSPDGSMLASGSGDGTVRIWNASTSAILRTLTTLAPGGHPSSIWSISWSPDGTKLASASNSDAVHPNGTVRFWDISTGAILRTLGGTSDVWISSISWSPDGSRLASGSAGEIRISDPSTGTEFRTLSVPNPSGGHLSSVSSVAWSPNVSRLASASGDTIHIWDTSTGVILRTLNETLPPYVVPRGIWISSISWSPDGTKVASGSSDGTVRIWDVSTTQEQVQTTTTPTAKAPLKSPGFDAAVALAALAGVSLLYRWRRVN